MSWDADLTDDRGHVEGDWNYTHNCNGMANAVIDDEVLIAAARRWWERQNRPDVVARIDSGEMTGTWWEVLDGMSGTDGAVFLDHVIGALEADPERFRAMNPSNGWGDYDTFLRVLTEMRDAVPERPTTWRVSG